MAGCENCISCGLYTLPNDALAVKLQGVGGSNGVAGSFSGGLGCDASDPSTSPVQSGLYVVVDGVTTFLDSAGKVTSKNARGVRTVRSTATLTCTNGTPTTAVWGATDESTTGVWNTGLGMSPITNGVYLFTFRGAYTATLAAGNHYVRMAIDGVTFYDYSVNIPAIVGGFITVTTAIPLLANQNVTAVLVQTSGVTATLAAGATLFGAKVSE